MAGSPAGLVVMLNQKNGTFAYDSKLEPPIASGNIDPSAIFAIAVGATTASGYTDVVAVWTDSNENTYVETFLNDGTGSFPVTQMTTYNDPGSRLLAGPTVALADVNGDGKPDLLLEKSFSQSAAVEVALGKMDGTFAPPQPAAYVSFPGSYTYSTNLTVASLTGDPRRQDILLSGPYGPYLAMSNGDGTYQQARPALPDGAVSAAPGTAAAIPYQVIGVQTADLNRDGKPDLILTVMGGLATYLGNGDGTFGPVAGTASLSDNEAIVELQGRNAYPRHGIANVDTVSQTVFADWKGDGYIGFAFSDQYFGYIGIGIGQGDGTFSTPHLLYSSSSPAISPLGFSAEVTADIDGDGISDLIGRNLVDGSEVVALAKGNGAFTYKQALAPLGVSSGFFLPVHGDFNGDGRTDFVRMGADGSLAIALTNADGTLQTPVTIPLGHPLTCSFILPPVVVGDVNGDGRLDVVLAYPGDAACIANPPASPVPSGYYVALGSGDGTFAPGRVSFVPFGTSLQALAIGRLHGPGQPLDIVLADYDANQMQGTFSYTTTLLAGHGDGTFAPQLVLDSQHDIQWILTDDYNGDGKSDLTLIASTDFNNPYPPSIGIFLLPGQGDGTFGKVSRVTASPAASSAQYADLNGDGALDLILLPQAAYSMGTTRTPGDTSAGVSVLLGDGKGNFAAPINYPNPGNAVLVGNFLGDNTLSFVGTGNGATAFFMNQGGTTLTLTPSGSNLISGQTLTLAAALHPTLSNRPIPSGTLVFYDGQTAIGTGTLANGAYTFTAPALAAGAHTLSVAYSGDANFQANRSANVSVTVTASAPDYSISSSTTSLTVSKGTSGTVTLNMAVNPSLSGQLTFACAGLPAEASCSFSPASLTVAAGQTASDTLTISTKAASTSARTRVAADRYVLPRGLVLAGLLVFFLPFRRRRGVLFTLSVLLALGSFAGLSGCAGSNAATTPIPITDPGTPTGSSIVTVTATAVSGDATITHDLTINLIVQ